MSLKKQFWTYRPPKALLVSLILLIFGVGLFVGQYTHVCPETDKIIYVPTEPEQCPQCPEAPPPVPCPQWKYDTQQPCNTTAPLNIYFGPHVNLQDPVIDEIIDADQEILIAVFIFTDKDVMRQLGMAARRGVTVKILVDEKYAEDGENWDIILDDSSVEILLYPRKGWTKLHNKFMVVDGDTVLTGSPNYSYYGLAKNHENLLVIEDPEITRLYEMEFWRLWNNALRELTQ